MAEEVSLGEVSRGIDRLGGIVVENRRELEKQFDKYVAKEVYDSHREYDALALDEVRKQARETSDTIKWLVRAVVLTLLGLIGQVIALSVLRLH